MRQNDQSTTQLQNNISRQSPMRLAHRVVLLLAILLVGGNAAWGQTFNGSLISEGIIHDGQAINYIQNDISKTTIDMTGELATIVSELNTLSGASYTTDNIYQHIYIRWCIKNSSGIIFSGADENFRGSPMHA